MTSYQKGTFAAFKGFIKGKKEVISLATLGQIGRENKSSASDERNNQQHFDFDSDQEMKTFWFKNNTEPAQESWLPGLTKKQRIIGFFTFLIAGVFCFTFAGMLTPFLIVKARKFALLYTMGSCFTVGSFSILWGPMAHLKHLCSYKRLPFTLAYFGTMFATLYCALVLKKTLLTLIFAVVQIIALVWYVISYVPGGTTGLKFFSKLCASVCTKTVSKTLPV